MPNRAFRALTGALSMGPFRKRSTARREWSSYRQTVAVFALFVSTFYGLSARGQQASPPTVVRTRLELTLPEGCGSPELFLGYVRARSDRIAFHPDETSLVVRAAVLQHPSGSVRAEIALLKPDGTVASRTIEAGNCEEALDALALVTAVTLDPTYATRATEPRAVPPTPPAPAPPAPSVKPTPPPPVPAQKPPLPASYVALSLLGVGSHGVVPRWMAGVEGALSWSLVRRSVLAPSVRLGLRYQTRRDVAASGGLADFALTSATLDLCPLNAVAGPVELRPCGLLVAGMMGSEGHDTLEPESHRRNWFAVGAAAEFDLVLSRNWSIPLRGTVEFPLVRDRYQFAPSAFFRTEFAVFGGSAGLQARFR